MGMDVGEKGSLKAEINVTPMADVMLVLLIIIMLVAPMLQRGVDVRLPRATYTEDKPETQNQTVLAITADRRFYVDALLVSEADMVRQIQDVLERKRERIVLIKGDEDAPYAAIMAAMDKLREVGIEDIGLITERRLRPGEAAGMGMSLGGE
jgi:biopolymer transport protein TolR